MFLWCSCGGVFVVVWCSTGVVLEWGVLVFLWLFFCGGVFVVVWCSTEVVLE